jgi:hypothetical protein
LIWSGDLYAKMLKQVQHDQVRMSSRTGFGILEKNTFI